MNCQKTQEIIIEPSKSFHTKVYKDQDQAAEKVVSHDVWSPLVDDWWFYQLTWARNLYT